MMTEVVEVPVDCEAQKKQHIIERIQDELKRVSNYVPRVGVFGDAGAGKSSLCNALFGNDIAQVSHVDTHSCMPQEILIGDKDNGGMILVDVPGIGNDTQHHAEHIHLYKKLIHGLDVLLWTIKADEREYMSSMDVYRKVIEPNLRSCPVVFAITQTDKIEPYRDWDKKSGSPGEKQMISLQFKVNDISSRFNVSTNKIVPVSSVNTYNLHALINKLVDMLPKEENSSLGEYDEEIFLEELLEMQKMEYCIF